jgi:asparagine synthase (glutamine-hydrolysing)
MCGILGVIGNDSKDVLNRMMPFLKHRGPDSQGIYNHQNLSLGHHRLSILDLSSAGHQPMHSSDGRYTIIFNGEIYNHLDIRNEIKDKYSFISTSDTETILYGFAEFGQEIFNRLNGIFALAIFDRDKNEIVLARDQLGVKPLYYYAKDNHFIFASELKALLASGVVDKSIDLKSVYNYLTLLWSPGEGTPLSFVKKLEPGHLIKFKLSSPSDFSITKYFDLVFDSTIHSQVSDEELFERFEDLLVKGIRRQLLSDVPVGYFLSGGLDSSAVVALARRFKVGERPTCFTISSQQGANYEGFANDLTYARKLSKLYDLQLVEVEGDYDVASSFDKMIYSLDEPQADLAPLHVYNISQKAKEMGFKVLLGGAGGDDILSGYRRHQLLRFNSFIDLIPESIRSSISNLSGELPVSYPALRRLKKLLSGIGENRYTRMANSFLWLSSSAARSLFSAQSQVELSMFDPRQTFSDLLSKIPDEKSDLNKMLYWEMKTFLPDHNLTYTDKMSMAHGVEARVPLLDLEFVKFCNSLPPRLKLNGLTTKYIFRQVMRKYIPTRIIDRPKSGFGAPVRKWINKDLSPLILDYLSPSRINNRGIFDSVAVQSLITDTKNGKRDGAYSILSLLSLESWFSQFVDSTNLN